ncbi:hypothetical protein EMIHUDRAFT_443431 [Emiliania huxleyi CCMP1516]|uniref:Uncharacterized protein n=2 Tax=Emiliania huxleyi TaxID=2903 RepID=A0A0D3JS08_EMIH1|nr:hypothetical protein EMIHUDRAFT_443431 [Emiliania huxleyi CCMP1516]EOD26293.1 hypothetical protein EMIHUDRAFT_443431 [Emiliania huxleyi CCMP1516]|eukprot:XP_005778722.1 hypothetical protein EMIHUDRAFT_443431 [Emiliania huxleyi CCMP1516]
MRRGRRFCSTAATSRLVSKIGRPTSALSTERSLDFLRAKGLDAEDLLLVSILVKTNAGVESIDVSGNGFGAGGAESLVAIVRSSPQLSKLDASQNNLRASAALLAEAAAAHGSLRSLAMSANAIGASACTAIAEALAAAAGGSGLAELNLSHNAFGRAGGGLAAVPGLSSLRLASCAVGAAGTTELAAALAAGSTLRRLDLHECHCGADGAAALAEALTSGVALVSLDLSDNNIGDKSGLGSSGVSADAAVEALARCLRSSASLRELDLRLNGFDAVHLEELAAAAREGDGKRREPIELRL